mgnify:FL=1
MTEKPESLDISRLSGRERPRLAGRGLYGLAGIFVIQFVAGEED